MFSITYLLLLYKQSLDWHWGEQLICLDVSVFSIFLVWNADTLTKQQNNTSLVLRHTRDVCSATEHNSFSQFTEPLGDNSAKIERDLMVPAWHYLWQLHTTLYCHADIHWLLLELHVCLQGATTGSCTCSLQFTTGWCIWRSLSFQTGWHLEWQLPCCF